MDKILILDFGDNTASLIGKKLRELGVYCELIPGNTPLTEAVIGKPGGTDANGYNVRGIIMSGSPESVYSKDGPVPDQKIYTCGLPILGICYGLQRMTYDNGGMVEALIEKEFGHVEVKGHFPTAEDGLADLETTRRFFAAFDPSVSLEALRKGTAVCSAGKWPLNTWMSHGDTISKLAPGFRQYGESKDLFPAVVIHESKPWFGLIFHPEIAGCERSIEIFAAFAYGVSQCTPYWNMEYYAEETSMAIGPKVGKNPVLLLVSGGVDSTVSAALLLKILDPDQIHLMYMDTGLMRKDETTNVKTSLEKLGARHIHLVHCEKEFLQALMGVEDPERKRKIIGDTYIKIQERETARLGLQNAFLAQGTIYPDILESGKGKDKTGLVKSHHNVGTPLVQAKREAGLVIEPLSKLFKDEVRALGRCLKLDEEILRRHPFPGPGLAVRILGEVTQEKCEILREADAIFIDELKKRKAKSGQSLYDEIWQAFAVLLPLRSVGVAGNLRRYGWVLALRAITSTDAMTAEVYPFETKDLLEISALITSNIKEIGRVTYDISGKPPATIEWE